MCSWAGHPDYDGMEILSPMVRASTLPLRLCSLEYGAGLVYSGATIDQKMIGCARMENLEFGCIDYVSRKDRHVVFSTCNEERERVIFQLATADSALATQAALTVSRDVRGVDVNMGCCAPFSTEGGRGSVLLDKPELVADILKSLRRELPAELSLSCKIRMLSSVAKTRDFMQVCEQSGVSAIAIHMRSRDEEIGHGYPAHWPEIMQLCDAVRVPVIANGDFMSRQHISDFWSLCRRDAGQVAKYPAAVMIARGALWNPSIFCRDADNVNSAPKYEDVVRNYIRTAMRVNSPVENTKWVLKEMLNHPYSRGFDGMIGKQFRQFKKTVESAKTLQQTCEAFGETYKSQDYPPGSHTLEYGWRKLIEQDALEADKAGLEPLRPCVGGG